MSATVFSHPQRINELSRHSAPSIYLGTCVQIVRRSSGVPSLEAGGWSSDLTGELERLQLGILGDLCQLPRESLVELCDFLAIAGPNLQYVADKNRMSLVTLINNYLHREELEELEDKGMSSLLSFKDKILEVHAESDVRTVASADQPDMLPSIELQNAEQGEQVSEQNELIRQIEEMQFQPSSMQRQAKMERKNKECQKTTNGSLLLQNTAQPQALSFWSREFKISGQIGEPGQKDRLTFSSLARQIEHGLNKGVSEVEIVDAVIRAIAPGMQLRSYLEGRANLTLPTLRRILRSHYQERSATELYKQLTSEVQGIKETPQAFLIRALDLRQKILFASQESESGLKYDSGLVQNLFLHTVLTGLQNDNIKRDLQPYLEQSDITDELLLERLNIACAYEMERNNKRKMITPQRPVPVHSVHSEVTLVENKEKITQPKQCKMHPEVLSELKEMKSGMALLKELRAEVSQIKESMQQPLYSPKLHLAQTEGPGQKLQSSPQVYDSSTVSGWQENVVPHHMRTNVQHPLPPHYHLPSPRRSQKRGCFKCQQRGAEVDCMHCFRCGSDEHFMAGCRAKGRREVKYATLNEERSLPRDGEWPGTS
ncbi:hypothetical protein MHYP_G00260450 [Metynnis hypsauchen]